MTKVEAGTLAERIRDTAGLEAEPQEYGRGLWTVLVVDDGAGVEREFRNAREWGEDRPAREFPIGSMPTVLPYPPGGELEVPKARREDDDRAPQ